MQITELSSLSRVLDFPPEMTCRALQNLGLSIDELYFLCELECDEAHMREAMQVLSEAGDDFRELKARVEKQDRFERERRATRGLPVVHRRNRAIAWEVRGELLSRVGMCEARLGWI